MRQSTLYTDFADFQSYTDGLEADTTYDQLQPSIRTAAQKMKVILSAAVMQEILDSGEVLPDMRESLLSAVANRAMYEFQIFSTVKKNGTEASLYKYQHEAIRQHYISAFWNSTDEILSFLDEHPETAGWQDSEQYRLRQELPVRSAAEFERYFQIGESAYFFSKIVYIIRDCWDRLRPALPADASPEVMDLAKKALCYDVMSRVVLTFDQNELPESIRLDANHEFSKDGGMAERKALAAQFQATSADAMQAVALKTRTASAATGSANSEKNKFYMTL